MQQWSGNTLVQKIYVYRYQLVESPGDVMITSPRMATLSTIRKAGGIVDAASARLVRHDSVDADGSYPRQGFFHEDRS
jgi:hypothetical protein